MAALALMLIACDTASPGPPLDLPPPNQLPASATSHVVVIVMENKSYGEVVGSPDAPYFNSLGKRYALPARMYGIRHPSLPNYLALIGGDTFGIDSNCTDCHVKARNLADQLDAVGYTWKGYMEGMPRRCFRGAGSGQYAKKHNPFVYFDSIRKDPARCNRVVPYRRLADDLRAGSLPDFVFITPDLCNDTHDCGVATGDRYLKSIVPALLRELGPHGLLFVTYDEGRDDAGCCENAAGGRIPTVVAGPDVKRGVTAPDRRYSLYSVLRTIEEGFGVPLLRHAGDARTRAMGALFERPHRGAMRRPPR